MPHTTTLFILSQQRSMRSAPKNLNLVRLAFGCWLAQQDAPDGWRMNCWGGLRQAQALSHLAKLPRREGFACPRCKTAPPLGDFWKCWQCSQAFDTFQTRAVCPHCAAQFAVTKCLDCGGLHPMSDWSVPPLYLRSCSCVFCS
jgi:hypothetical protein